MTEERRAQDLHVSVMQDRCVNLLAPALAHAGAVYVDGTLGMGGHAEAVLDRCPEARLIGIDRDPFARKLAAARLARFGDRVTIVGAVFHEVQQVIADLGVAQVDAMLLDLGVSSLQLDDDERGFAYSRVAPLDMRMNPESGATAADLVNTLPVGELAKILSTFGEEKFARNIAKNIVAQRAEHPFETSQDLVAVIERSIPAAAKKTGGHPAKRTFQALRIAVNQELEVLTEVLPAAADALPVGGRLVVLSFQSLEDRIVKNVVKRACSSSTPLDLPVELPEHAPLFTDLARGGEPATDVEVAENSRAASVRLRAMERKRSGSLTALLTGSTS